MAAARGEAVRAGAVWAVTMTVAGQGGAVKMVMVLVGAATEEGAAVKEGAATVVMLVAAVRVVAEMKMVVKDMRTVPVGRAAVKAARAEAGRAGVVLVAEERVWAWMEEVVMGVEAIGVAALVVVVVE